jgi:hypothetical protein
MTATTATSSKKTTTASSKAPDDSSKTTAFTVSPDEAALALRMGWVLAELRGRLDPNSAYEPLYVTAPPTLVLDQAGERNPVESQIEATKILSSIGSQDQTKIDIKTLSGIDEWGPIPTGGPALTTTDMLRYLVCGLIYASTPQGEKPLDVHATLTTRELTQAEKAVPLDNWWYRLQWFFWAWDEALQDELSADKFGTASAYELGRGLSESFWALNQKTPDDHHAQWGFLLGKTRVDALCDLARRLAPVFNAYTAPAIVASVTKWGEIAKKPSAYEHPIRTLEDQIRIWRDLLVTGRDPLSLVSPAKLEAVARDPRPIIKAFRWELLAALVLAAGLALSLTYFSSEAKSALAALAAVGISASAIVSWIKARAQSVASRIGSAVDQSVVNDAVTRVPEPLVPTGWRHRIFLPLDHSN